MVTYSQIKGLQKMIVKKIKVFKGTAKKFDLSENNVNDAVGPKV